VVYIYSMKFELDENKSVSNKLKNGVNFVEIQMLWEDFDLLEIPAKSIQDEGRCLVIGKIDEKHWSVVITYRNDSIRIISARRSRKREILYYES